LKVQGEIWTLSFGHEVLRLKDTKGIRLLAALVQEPQREFHVLDLESPEGPVDGGDSGELLDDTARRDYRRRMREIATELEEAQIFQDLGRIESLTNEQEFLGQEIARAVGRRGSSRRGGGAAEKARVNVQRRLKDAIRRINEQSSAAGRHLTRSLRTGTYCSYEP
jgi:hypothetical protein